MKKTTLLLPLIFIIFYLLALLLAQDITAGTTQIIDNLLFKFIPSVFPFILLTSLFIKLGGAHLLSYFLQYITVPIFNISALGSITILIGIIAGFPHHINYGNNLVKSAPIYQKETQLIINSIFFPSLPFLINALAGNSGNYKLFFLFALYLYLAGFLKLFICSAFSTSEKVKLMKFQDLWQDFNNSCDLSFNNLIVKTIIDSVKMLIVLSGIIILARSFLIILSTVWNNIYLYPFIELIGGSANLSSSYFDMLILSIAMAFGSISVLFQAFSFMDKLSKKSLLLNRFYQIPFNLIFFLFLPLY